ncbi:hypothetical protein KY289_000785 [Solanum tuberosum]|nr:hypothetical protein KY289_000785 [Solanum tuberosum]
MAHTSKGQGSKRRRSEGIPECMIVDTIPKDLWLWWTGMRNYEQRRKSPSSWGKGSSIRGADLRNKRPIIPKNIDAKKFLDLLDINQIEKESLKNGLIVFPKWDKHIDIRLAGVVNALTTMESPTIIPMILADMFRALTKCKNGETYFEGCNILLQIWFLEHLYHHDRAPRFTPDWSKDVICMSIGISFLVLIALRGVQPYAPLRVMCQLDKVQEVVPPNDDMSRFVFDTPLGFAFDSQDILKIWFGSIISEQSEMVVE